MGVSARRFYLAPRACVVLENNEGFVFGYYFVRMSECMSCICVFQISISSVCFKRASHAVVFFKHTEHTFWQKVRAYLSCIAVFLAEICFVCTKRASR